MGTHSEKHVPRREVPLRQVLGLGSLWAYVAKKGKNAALLAGGACSAHPRLLSLKAPTLRENSPRNKDKRRILL